jgi:hypothetical protein
LYFCLDQFVMFSELRSLNLKTWSQYYLIKNNCSLPSISRLKSGGV